MIARCLAGTVLGFPLAGMILALALHWLPNHGQSVLVPALILFFPLWTAFMIACYAFRSGARAFGVLAAANLAVFALLWLSRHLSS